MTTARLASKLGLQHLRVWEGNLVERVGKPFYRLQYARAPCCCCRLKRLTRPNRTKTFEGKPFYLHALENKVVLISNIANQCNWAKPNLDKLSELELKYRGQLQILLYPSSEFAKNENANEVRDCVNKYGGRFHLMERTQVNGPSTHEVFAALKKATGTEDIDINWNYETKFLVSREGHHVERFSNAMDPASLVPFIDRLVGEIEPLDESEIKIDEPMTKSPASFVNTG